MAAKQSRPAKVTFSRLVDEFKAKYPAEWETMRLTPAQHALQEMAKKLG